MAKYNYRQLICHLEYIVAQHCYNDNNRNGYFRYPVHYKKDSEWYYTKGNYITGAPRESLLTLHYRFGANRLYIGEALAEMVNYLVEEIDCSTSWLEPDERPVICKLEYYVAQRCYNSKYGNGYYRYPVKYYSEGTLYKTKVGAVSDSDVDLKTMYYDFGANRLYIGRALCEVMKFIINNYDHCSELLEEYNDDEIEQANKKYLEDIFWNSSPLERIELLKQKDFADLFPDYVKLFKEGNPNEGYD